MIEIIVQILLWISGIFTVIGALGLFRFPDFYTRSHAATVVSVGGVCLALFALMLSVWFSAFSIKVLAVIILNLVVGPTATHAIADSAYDRGVRPKVLVKNELGGSK